MSPCRGFSSGQRSSRRRCRPRCGGTSSAKSFGCGLPNFAITSFARVKQCQSLKMEFLISYLELITYCRISCCLIVPISNNSASLSLHSDYVPIEATCFWGRKKKNTQPLRSPVGITLEKNAIKTPFSLLAAFPSLCPASIPDG